MAPKKIWKEEEQAFIYEQFRYKNKTLHWIAEQLGTNRQGIGKLIKDKEWLRAYEDPEWLYDMNWNEEMSFGEMAEVSSCNLDTIRVNFRKHSLDANPKVRYRGVRKYEVDDTYFDEIDSHEKAYWIGFITADGSIEHIGCNTYRLGINLARRDKYHLERFKSDIGSTHPIIDYETYLDVTGKTYPGCVLRISNSKICHKLMSYGILPNKSANENPCSQIPERFISSYLRGYFDGDGCFTTWFDEKRNRNVATFNLIGSEEILEHFKSILVKELSISKINIRKDGVLYRFDISSDESVLSIYNWLYNKDTTLYLKRKKLRFDSYFYPSSDIVRTSGESLES